jgi:hypothetical protein
VQRLSIRMRTKVEVPVARTSLRTALTTLLIFLATASAWAANCHTEAIRSLQRLSPEGFRVFQAYDDKQDFKRWIECGDIQGGLATAVHETIHAMTANRNTYPLVGGGTAWRVPESPDFYPPRLLRTLFPASSQYVSSYLTPGAASSADYFRYLLDEFNAYAHDLNTVVHLDAIRARDFDAGHRDGLASMMAFVATYIEMAHKRQPRTWEALQAPRVRKTVVTLWEQAEDVMGRSCNLARYSFETPDYLSRFCRATHRHGLGQLLGRPPLCPIRCKLQVASARHIASDVHRPTVVHEQSATDREFTAARVSQPSPVGAPATPAPGKPVDWIERLIQSFSRGGD